MEAGRTRKLLVVADDFGIGPKTSAAILDLAARGVVTAAVLLVNSPYATRSVAAWRQRGWPMELGWHPNLTLDQPIAPVAQVRSLIDHRGNFHRLGAFLRRWILGQLDAAEIERELTAQLQRYRELVGAWPDVVNAHQHVALFGPVGAILLRVLEAHGCRPYLRRLQEPWRLLTQVPGARCKRAGLNLLGRRATALQDRAGFPGNDWLVGITDPAWVKDRAYLARWLAHVPGTIVELMCHPGYLDPTLIGRDGTATDGLLERRVDEFARLQQDDFHIAVRAAGFELAAPSQYLRGEKTMFALLDAYLPEHGRAHARRALLLWVAILLVIGIRAALQPQRNTVYPIFTYAGSQWAHGETPYDYSEVRDHFRYTPLVAAFFAPWSYLPAALGGPLWRMLNAALFFGGLIAYCRAVDPSALRENGKGFAVLALGLIPMSLASLNNGQANPLVIGLLMLAAACVIHERWDLAAVCLAVPILFKIYPLAVALLLWLMMPGKLGWRLLFLLVVGLALPFVLQDPGYVAREYRTWLDLLGGDDRRFRAVHYGYRDAYLLLRLIGIQLGDAYVLVQLATAAGIAGLVVVGRTRAWNTRDLVAIAFDLGCGWMILFGPATENCTFILLAPTCARALREAWQPGRPLWTRFLLTVILCLFTASMLVTALPNGRSVVYFMNPLAALLLVLERLACLSRSAQSHEDPHPAEANLARAT